MEFSIKNIFCVFVVILITIGPVHNAPKSSPAKYDQKQSGDYNVQVHLKDIHIIALLGEDALGGNGDYDYNYDYSDLTIKPVIHLTTENPNNSNTSESSNNVDQQKPEVDSEKPEVNSEKPEQPDITISSSSTVNPLPTIPVVVISENAQPQENKDPEKPKNENVSSTEKPVKPEEEANEKKTESPVTNISIVPSTGSNKEISQNDQHLPLGEIMHNRRCLGGFVRDKEGRCRKIRRTPHIPFGITRFATNLASRFRQAAIGSSTSSLE